ncbi:MAG: GNAT family N-acetyltransferase [Rhodothermia bacterium]
MDPIPVTLVGETIRLEPLSEDHLDALAKVGLDPDIWDLNPGNVATRDQLAEYVAEAIRDAEAGEAVPFAIVLNDTGKAIGSTRYGSIDRGNCRLEIGWTWIGRAWWRTGVNTECKLLLLQHAFEVLGCARVEMKTDTLNRRSRTAILRIGASEEGILRKHILTSSGRWRDTAYYSILDDEWPDVKQKLEAMRTAYG